MISFVSKVIAKKGHLIHQIKGPDHTGHMAYYFVLVEPIKRQSFLDVIESGDHFTITDYGKVIASCYGEEPTDEVKKLLKDEYNFDVE